MSKSSKATATESRFVSAKLGKNYEAVSQVRTLGAFLAGMAAGILGLTGLVGALFFLVCAGVVSFFIVSVACGSDASRYFPRGSKEVFSFEQIVTGAMTYVLVWTVTYDAIYIF